MDSGQRFFTISEKIHNLEPGDTMEKAIENN